MVLILIQEVVYLLLTNKLAQVLEVFSRNVLFPTVILLSIGLVTPHDAKVDRFCFHCSFDLVRNTRILVEPACLEIITIIVFAFSINQEVILAEFVLFINKRPVQVVFNCLVNLGIALYQVNNSFMRRIVVVVVYQVNDLSVHIFNL